MALRQRKTWIGRVALGWRRRERQRTAIAVAEFAIRERRPEQVPAGERARGDRDIGQPNSGKLVAIGIHRRNQGAEQVHLGCRSGDSEAGQAREIQRLGRHERSVGDTGNMAGGWGGAIGHPGIHRHQQGSQRRRRTVRIARILAIARRRRRPGAPAMLGAGDQIQPRGVRQFQIAAAVRIGGKQGRALLPVFGAGIGLHQQRIETILAQQRGLGAGGGIACAGGGERKEILRHGAVLIAAAGAVRLGEQRVEEHPADAGGVAEHAIEHFLAGFIAIEAEPHEIAQEAAGLGNAEANGLADGSAQRIVRRT